MSCSLNNPGDCFKNWEAQLKKMKFENFNDFFDKLEKDIKHFPEDLQKAINDTKEEMKRFNVNFNDLFNKTIENAKEVLSEGVDAEEFAKTIGLKMAKNTGNKDNCSLVVGGLLVALGTSMKVGSSAVPNPYADYLIVSGPAIAMWACSEAYK
ncbi:hypothetical protein ACTHS9_01655 [Bacillus mycoides]|uniref:hypothetical protein n=1 Tax=Bacillus mycoides TaxID=1405 RepID=UPI003F7C7BD3